MGMLEIQLPEPLMAFVEAQVASGQYESPSALIEALVREAQERQERRRASQETLEWALLEGLDSGEPVALTAAYGEERRAALQAQLGRES